MRSDFTPFMRKSIQIWDHFIPLVFPRDSENITSLDIGLREVGAKRRLNGVNKGKKIRKKNFFCCGNFRPFLSKNVQIWDQFFPKLFPKDSESLKSLYIQLQEVGAKRGLNGTSKVNKWRRKKSVKTFFNAVILDHFWTKMFKSETISFQYFSPRIQNL